MGTFQITWLRQDLGAVPSQPCSVKQVTFKWTTPLCAAVAHLHQFICLRANVCLYECLWHHLFLGANWQHFMLLFLWLCAHGQVTVPLCSFHGGELGNRSRCFQWFCSDDTLVALLQGPHLLPSQWRMMRRLTAKQGPLLPVISPNLQNSFFKRPRC